MKPTQFTHALSALGWSQKKFSEKTGVTDVTVSRWATGKSPIPPWVGEHLRVLQLAKDILGD